MYRVPWSKKIFLTFDDGPHPVYTPKLLNILHKHSIPATFFLQGSKARKYPEIVNEINSHGHTVANHTHSHIDLSKCSPRNIFYEIKECSKSFSDNYTLRPPYGGINLFSMLLTLAMNYNLVFWSIDSEDHKRISQDLIVNNVLINNPRRGDIILFHDDNEKTIKALPTIITALLDNKLSFGSL